MTARRWLWVLLMIWSCGGPAQEAPPPNTDPTQKPAEQAPAKVEEKAPPSILMGRHLIELGLKPSPGFKKILDAVYEMQLDGKIQNLEEAIAAAREIIKNSEITGTQGN